VDRAPAPGAGCERSSRSRGAFGELKPKGEVKMVELHVWAPEERPFMFVEDLHLSDNSQELTVQLTESQARQLGEALIKAEKKVVVYLSST
jgi:hypothetical protein